MDIDGKDLTQNDECEDGGPGSEYMAWGCELGTDCLDCGVRCPFVVIDNNETLNARLGNPRNVTPLSTEEATALSKALGFLHREYEPRYFWWEIVEVVKKLVLVGFAAIVFPGSVTQVDANASSESSNYVPLPVCGFIKGPFP